LRQAALANRTLAGFLNFKGSLLECPTSTEKPGQTHRDKYACFMPDNTHRKHPEAGASDNLDALAENTDKWWFFGFAGRCEMKR